jgi:electron transfer flavoprotein alpha subunit
MKALLIGEYRDGAVLGSTYELVAFAREIGVDAAMLIISDKDRVPAFQGRVYWADVAEYGEYNPDAHKKLVQEAIARENPDLVILAHSSYGWDLAPRIAATLKAAQISEVVEYTDGTFVVPFCNAKMRRSIRSQTDMTVVTLQAGAFELTDAPEGSPDIETLTGIDTGSVIDFEGYEAAVAATIDLSRADVIVSAGRGVGKKENVKIVAGLAKALGGELGASRPVIDSGWVDHSRQIGTTGQTVSPKLYVACGISGAIQHLAGMKKSEFIVAINPDRDAPISEIADVMVLDDFKAFVPALIEKLKS